VHAATASRLRHPRPKHLRRAGPRAGLPGADPRLRLWASWLARITVVVVLIVVILGLALRG